MTQQELLDQPYSINPFSEGMIANDFRTLLQQHGEAVRYFKGYENAGQVVGPNGETAKADGTLLVEQNLADGVRVYFSQSKTTIQTAEWGIFEAGSATVSTMPDEIELARGDRLVRIGRTALKRCALEPSGETVDALPWPFVALIVSIFTPTGPLSPDAYSASDKGIRWLMAPPQVPLLIEYRVHPSLEFMGEDDRLPPLGADQNTLVRTGVVRLVKPGD